MHRWLRVSGDEEWMKTLSVMTSSQIWGVINYHEVRFFLIPQLMPWLDRILA